MTVELPKAGIHSLVYSNTYSVLLTAGFENNVNIFIIHPLYNDSFLLGKLIGHTSMVTAVEVIEKTPMAITADDSGALKIWDIRSLICI